MLSIRPTEEKDLEELKRIYAFARSYMKSTNNPNQWKDDKPDIDDVLFDIRRRVNYVMEDEGRICATFSAIPGRDPTYAKIDGDWLNDDPYVTIHKIASDGSVRGVLETAIRFCQSIAKNIRIDTHEENAVMRHLLQKNGFAYCGIIKLLNGEPRLAFQKVF